MNARRYKCNVNKQDGENDKSGATHFTSLGGCQFPRSEKWGCDTNDSST